MRSCVCWFMGFAMGGILHRQSAPTRSSGRSHSGRAAVALAGQIALCWSQMRIDPNGLIGGCPALVVRKALRHLRVWDQWEVADLEAVAALAAGHRRRSGQGIAN